ncbi:MAG: DUF3313 domain-containing protein [Halieaceae bacterium]|nr:DUF3313 domain-containing protein [Halieaceae bacterium]
MLKYCSLPVILALVALGGCAQVEQGKATAPERGDAAYLKGVDTRSDELYVKANTPEEAMRYRRVYIARADLDNVNVIPAEADNLNDDWVIEDAEVVVIQDAINREFTATLSFQSAYTVVDSPENAEIILNTTVVAIHPNETFEQVAAGARPSGSITASLALVDASTGRVLVRSVDTRSTDNIWAFNQLDNQDAAVDAIFRAWGNSIRRGMLALQGRSSDPLAPVLRLEEQ